MPNISYHGGSCCGIRHIHGFGYGDHPRHVPWRVNRYTIEDEMQKVQTIIKEHTMHSPGHLLEVVLNSNQMRGRADKLIEMGFKLVTRFMNPTGMICHVFHYTEAPRPAKPRVRGVPKPLYQVEE